MKELIGHIIRKLGVSPDQSTMYFKLEDGKTYAQTLDADCCSESWFADVINFPAMMGTTILSVTKIELPEYNTDDGRTRQDVDQVYGVRITSIKGNTTIAFRNSSNGYYWGCLYVFSEVPVPLDLVRITEDWSA